MLNRNASSSIDDVRHRLESVIPDTASIIVVHSGIWGFARDMGIPIRDVPDAIIDVLMDIAGTKRTLIMPAFTFQFPGSKVFDKKRTKPQTGILVESFLKHPGVRRSSQPIFSYAAFGPDADAMLSCRCSTAWGKDSVMGWFEDVDALFVSLGVHSLLSCTYYHTAEERQSVPYRYHKRFTGTLYDDGKEVGPCEEVFFVRPLGVEMEFLGKPADDRLENEGYKIRPPETEGVFVESMTVRDIIRISSEVITDDPYAMVLEKDRDAVRTWIDAGNLDKEIATLGPEQKYTLE